MENSNNSVEARRLIVRYDDKAFFVKRSEKVIISGQVSWLNRIN